MNGYGGGGNVLTIPELPVPSYTPSPVYTGGGNAPYATDQPALIPEPVVPAKSYYDWEAPLNFDNLNFPSETPSAPVPQTPSAPVPQEIYETPRYSSEDLGPYVQPTYPLYEDPFESYAPEAIRTGELKEPGYGPLELAGDTVKTVAKVAGNVGEMAVETVVGAGKAIIDLGKFIFDHLQIGGTYTGSNIPGTPKQTPTTPTTYQTSSQQTAADLAKLQAQYYADLVARGKMTAAEAITRGVGLGIDTLANVLPQQPYLTTPIMEAAPNYLLYAGLAIAGYLLLKGR